MGAELVAELGVETETVETRGRSRRTVEGRLRVGGALCVGSTVCNLETPHTRRLLPKKCGEDIHGTLQNPSGFL